jgi:L-tyrosine reductase
MPALSGSEVNRLEYQTEPGLAHLLREKLELFDDGVAIESGDFLVTYGELHRKALRLARTIRNHQSHKEEPIGILAPRGINHILAQVAVVYAGGCCVPLDVDHRDSHLENLLRNLHASVILTDIDNRHRLPDLQHIIVDHTSDNNAKESNSIRLSQVSWNGPMCRSHIFHTSGSTGKPKAVQVLAAGIINLVFNKFDPVTRGHRLGHNCNVSFDVSLWEIWSSLLHGATLVVFERNVVLDPVVFVRRLQTDRIDVMWQTTSLLATIAHARPKAYATVDTLLTGGEAINLQTIRTIVAGGPPRRLFNVYGPTECSVFTTFHQITLEDVKKGHIPIGVPLSNYKVFVVDEDLQPVAHGEVGEMVVGGAGVAAGYFENPEKTGMAFVSAAHLSVECKQSTGLFYRTGDLVRTNEAGLIEYFGRRDNEVKIRGQRIELESIETFLLETKLVSAATALKMEPEDLTSGSVLLAYVIPESRHVDAQAITQAFTKLAPHLMVPQLQLVESFVLTGSGKVDRKRLARRYRDQLESARTTRSSRKHEPTGNTENRLQDIWHDVLGLPVSGFKSSDNFFLLGGTSLQAASLVSRIQHSFGIGVRVAALFENPTLRGMCNLVDKIEHGGLPADSVDKAAWHRDSQLGRGLAPIAGCPPDWRSKSEGRVFLTGATGFIGAFLLLELLTRPETCAVACLVRAKDAETGFRRLKDTFSKYGLSLSLVQEERIVILLGDIAMPDLGLGWEQYQFYSTWASVVFHLAAQVNFVQPYSTHRAANVLGTLNMIRFCNNKRLKELHYASSISAYGPTGLVTGATHLPEDEKPAAHLAALPYDTGYAQSQHVAEMVVWNAIENGLPITIYRPGFVLGHTKTGAVNPYDFFGRVVASCVKMGSYPLLAGQREEFVPVDFVASALLHIASGGNNYGHAYNLVHLDPTTLFDLPTLFEMINNMGLKKAMRGIAYSEWLNNISKASDDPLRPLAPMLEEKVMGNRTRWEMQQGMPVFGTENSRRALATCPELLQSPSIAALFEVCMPNWLRAAGV